MKTRMFLSICLVAVLCLPLIGCTEQQRAKQWGGTASTDLPPCKKLVNVTWKESDLWFLYRNMHEGEEAEQYEFREDSTFGLLEGVVTIKEHRDESCPQ